MTSHFPFPVAFKIFFPWFVNSYPFKPFPAAWPPDADQYSWVFNNIDISRVDTDDNLALYYCRKPGTI